MAEKIADLLLHIALVVQHAASLIEQWARSFIQTESPSKIGGVGEEIVEVLTNIWDFLANLI